MSIIMIQIANSSDIFYILAILTEMAFNSHSWITQSSLILSIFEEKV